jgi:hypothetical protein
MRVIGNRRSVVAKGAGAVAAGVGLVGASASRAAAHHSYPATYNTAEQVTVDGTVQLVRFTNPHVHIVIESPLEVDAAETAEVAGVAEVAGEGTAEASSDPAAAGATAEQAPPAEPPPATVWVLDLPGPGRLQQMGLTPATLPVGTPITVRAWPSRTPGSHDLAPLTITLGAGRTIRIR